MRHFAVGLRREVLSVSRHGEPFNCVLLAVLESHVDKIL